MDSRFLSQPNIPALVYGAIAFTILYLLSSVGLSSFVNWWYAPIPHDDLPERIVSSWPWRIFGWSIYLIPGFIAGFVARRSGLMHGAIVGALTAPIMAVFVYVMGFWSNVETSSLIYGLVLGLVWCSIAGLIGQLVAFKLWRK